MNHSRVFFAGGDRRRRTWKPPSRSPLLAAAGMSLAALSGCAGFSIGGSEYACPGMPDGARCLPAREIYAATDNGALPRTAAEKKAREVPAGMRAGASPPPDAGLFPAALFAARLDDRPMPLRTPARVMRIWIAPWQDRDGDLVLSGYLYTEIESRRWLLGNGPPQDEDEPSPHPLRTEKPETNAATSGQEKPL